MCFNCQQAGILVLDSLRGHNYTTPALGTPLANAAIFAFHLSSSTRFTQVGNALTQAATFSLGKKLL